MYVHKYIYIYIYVRLISYLKTDPFLPWIAKTLVLNPHRCLMVSYGTIFSPRNPSSRGERIGKSQSLTWHRHEERVRDVFDLCLGQWKITIINRGYIFNWLSSFSIVMFVFQDRLLQKIHGWKENYEVSFNKKR